MFPSTKLHFVELCDICPATSSKSNSICAVCAALYIYIQTEIHWICYAIKSRILLLKFALSAQQQFNNVDILSDFQVMNNNKKYIYAWNANKTKWIFLFEVRLAVCPFRSHLEPSAQTWAASMLRTKRNTGIRLNDRRKFNYSCHPYLLYLKRESKNEREKRPCAWAWRCENGKILLKVTVDCDCWAAAVCVWKVAASARWITSATGATGWHMKHILHFTSIIVTLLLLLLLLLYSMLWKRSKRVCMSMTI